jgi:hypothetical protein
MVVQVQVQVQVATSSGEFEWVYFTNDQIRLA